MYNNVTLNHSICLFVFSSTEISGRLYGQVGNIITLVLEEALLGNNDDDSTVKPIQQDISNCVIVAKIETYKYELWRTMFQLPSLVC